MPLNSFLLALPVEFIESKTKLLGLFPKAFPDWLIALNGLEISSYYKLINETLTWLIAISLGLFFYWTSKTSFRFRFHHFFLLSIPFLFMLPGDSSDLFGYIARGWQQAEYGMNPYAEVVASIENWKLDPMLANLLWPHNPSPYGPLFMLLAKFSTWLSGGNFFLAIFLFKLFNFLIFGLLINLVYKFSKNKDFLNLNFNPVYLIVFNPFIWIEALWNTHNDLLMGFLIFLSFYLAYKKKYNWSIFSLGLSVLVKYFSLVLFPFLLIYIVFDQAKPNAQFSKKFLLDHFKKLPWLGLGAFTALSAFSIGYYKLLEINHKAISGNMVLAHKSFYNSLDSIYKYLVGDSMDSIFLKLWLVVFGCFGIMIFIFYLRKILSLSFFSEENYRENLFKNFLKYSFWVLAALILIFSPKFHSWYLLTLIPLGIWNYPQFVFYFSIAHLFSLTFIDQADILNFLVLSLFPLGLGVYFHKLEKN